MAPESILGVTPLKSCTHNLKVFILLLSQYPLRDYFKILTNYTIVAKEENVHCHASL